MDAKTKKILDTFEDKYTLLGRFKSNFDYVLLYPNETDETNLYMKSVSIQIEAMLYLYDNLDIKPEWLSRERIKQYEKDLNQWQGVIPGTYKINTMALIIEPKGVVRVVYPMNGTDFQIDELNDIVGGQIEIIRINELEIMVLNEEGKLSGLPVNEIATRVAHRCKAISPNDYIVGNVLYCNKELVK